MSYTARPITAEELQSIEIPVVHFKEGYAADEVDVFLEGCCEALRGGSGLSADDVEHHVFSTTYRNGYNASDVDLLLDRIAQTLRSRSVGTHDDSAASSGTSSRFARQAGQPAEDHSSDSFFEGSTAMAFGGFLSKARRGAVKFAKDNDLEGKFRSGKAKAQEAFDHAKDEAGRIAAEDSLEGKLSVMREQSNRAWNGVQSNETIRKMTDCVQNAAYTVGNSVEEMRTTYEERKTRREQALEEQRYQSIQDRTEPLPDVPDSLVSPSGLASDRNEPRSSHASPDALNVGNQRGEFAIVPEDIGSVETVRATAGEESEERNSVAASSASVNSVVMEPSPATPSVAYRSFEEKKAIERPNHAKPGANTVADNAKALFADERKRPVLIGCVIALVLFAGLIYCVFQPAKDSKVDEMPVASSYSSASDSENESADEPSAPSFESIDTDSLKGNSAKDVVKELEEKDLAYGFLIEGGDGTDQSTAVKSSLEKDEEWIVAEARQSTTDGKVTLTVRKKETPKTKEEEPKKEETQQTANDNGIIMVSNNQDFASLLAVKDPFDSSVSAFAEKYKGRTVEFDGNIANVIANEQRPRYLLDFVLVHGGDYNAETYVGPEFRFEGVMWSDFHDGSVGLPLYVHAGQNVHIKATVGSYNPDNGILKLDFEEMTER